MQRIHVPVRTSPALWRPAALSATLAACFAAERARWALWLPVGFGAGIAAYFTLDTEPAGWVGAAAAALCALAAVATAGRQAVCLALIVGAVAAAGFGAAQLRSWTVSAPVLESRTGPVWIEGRVLEVQARVDDRRLLLDRLGIPRRDAARTPERVRITLAADEPALVPGQRIAVRAVLFPPPAPASPGAFDFARKAYFERLGGVGYAVSRARVVDDAAADGVAIAIAALRQSLTARIRAAQPEEAGGIAAALMTGDRGGIPESVMEAMRDSGLAHLLAISGLHIGLVGGLLFFAVRLGLALHERFALRAPIKKIAALCALLGAAAYLMISGGTVPTQRAFLMLALVMAAVVFDRLPISMNMVAWAAAAILLVAPETLAGVSFQMSFAAVIALVAVYESGGDRLMTGRRGGERLPRPLAYLAAVLVSTLVAGLATAPFALYHFNRVAVYGLLANLVAIPLTGFWIMPLAVAAFALMPFGLETVALEPMSWGIGLLIATAKGIQSLPGASVLIHAMPPAGLALICAGGLWVCLWRTRWRALGVLPVLCGLLTVPFAQPPDVLVDGEGGLMAVRAPDGGMALSGRADSFAAETWLRRSGEIKALPWPGAGRPATPWLRCDALGCVYRAGNRRVALVSRADALGEDCAIADVVISRVPVRRGLCMGPELVIDRFALWREGAHALWLAPDGIRVKSVRRNPGARPWSPQRRKAR
ncbi:MAG: DUF4131 domain-containing protein [Alphaproteobacteria bacterium]|nr:DUF4131 domain-containing protein [Alphaproteobacteria bacterium]